MSRPKSMRFKVESVLKKTSFYPFKTEVPKPLREMINTQGFRSGTPEKIFQADLKNTSAGVL